MDPLGTFAVVLLSVVPGLLWLWVFHRKDDHKAEPLGALLGAFALGGVSMALVLWLRPGLEAWLPAGPPDTRAALDAFLVTAPLEESVKLVAVVGGALLFRTFDEPLDGVVHGIAVGLGFASVENFLHGAPDADLGVVLARGATATLGHVAFTGSLGYFLGHARFARGTVSALLWTLAGFASATVLHGAYDFFLLIPGGLGRLALLGVLPLSLILLGWKIRHHRRRSPEFHPVPVVTSEVASEVTSEVAEEMSAPRR